MRATVCTLQVFFKGGRAPVKARLLVGADGGTSRVQKQCLGDNQLEYAGAGWCGVVSHATRGAQVSTSLQNPTSASIHSRARGACTDLQLCSFVRCRPVLGVCVSRVGNR